MSETEYEYIKERLPEWAKSVEYFAEAMANGKKYEEYYSGLLAGLTMAAKDLGALSNADYFVGAAIKNAREAAGNETA